MVRIMFYVGLALLLVAAAFQLVWLLPVACGLASGALVLHRPASKQRYEPCEPVDALDAQARVLYEQGKLTTDEFITAVETSRLPDRGRTADIARRYDARWVQSKHHTWEQRGAARSAPPVDLEILRSLKARSAALTNDAPGAILAPSPTKEAK